jgi:DNA-binding NarL/FixJ family response regulator
MTRVVIADDTLLVREGLLRLLEAEPGIEVVATCEDGDSALSAVGEHRPDVLVTDIRMPPSNRDEGIAIARKLRESHPEVGVVVLSQYVDPGYALALFDSGSERRGYLLKDRLSGSRSLGDAIRAVADGGAFVDPQVVDALVAARATQSASPLTQLTDRELEVLRLMATGLGNAAIARSLDIGQRAVERHINSIFAKLDLQPEGEVSRRVAATLIYLANAGAPPAST